MEWEHWLPWWDPGSSFADARNNETKAFAELARLDLPYHQLLCYTRGAYGIGEKCGEDFF